MKLGLNRKMLLSGILVLVIMVAVLWFSNRSIVQLTDDLSLSKQLSQLVQLSELMKEQSVQYDQNAPRDYESYNRDLKVYYSALQENIMQLNKQVSEVSHGFYNRGAITVLQDQELVDQGNQVFSAMEKAYQVFDAGFKEQIGDDPEAPRLEWGNQFILDDVSGLFARIDDASAYFEQLMTGQRQATVTYNWVAMLVIGLLLVVMLLWFNQIIVKRVIRVAKACREVTQGNYGLKVKDEAGDEIGQLVADFNRLSSRSKSVLTLVDRLHQATTDQQALNLIKGETQGIVNSSHLYWLTQKNNSYQVSLIASNKSQQALVGKALLKTDAMIAALDAANIEVTNDVLSLTVANDQAHFAKYLLNELNVHSMCTLKISRLGQMGILVFCKNSKQGFSESQVQTLEGLSALFASSLLK